MDLWVLFLAFHLVGSPDVPVKKEWITFQEKSTCRMVRQVIIDKISFYLRRKPSLNKKGLFRISNCTLVPPEEEEDS